MGISVGVAKPQTIASTGVANPGRITGVGVAQPGVISSVDIAHPGFINSGGLSYDQSQRTGNPALVSAGGGGGAPAQVYAPALDLAAIRAQARGTAESAVNPLYQRQLSDLLAREAVKRARGQADYTQNLESLDQQLQQLTEANTLTGTRTAEDTATNLGAINTAADISQQDQGTQFANDRIAQARALATNGLTTSGQGQQQTTNAKDTRLLTESRQAEDIQAKKTAQVVAKARTFEDLAKSTELGTNKTAEGKKQAKINLDRLIEDVDYEQNQGQQSLEKQRYQDVAAEQARQAKIAVQNFIAGIRDPAQRQAAYAAYGSAF